MDELILPIENEELIDEIRKYSCIHDVRCEDYKNAVVKSNAWETIAKRLAGKSWDKLSDNKQATYLQQLHRRWKSLRDCYGRSLRIAVNNRKKQRRPYIYSKHMNFLLPYFEQLEKERIVESTSWDGAFDDSLLAQISPSTKQCTSEIKSNIPSKVAKKEEICNSENSSEEVQDWEFHSPPSTGYKDDDPEKLFLLSLLPSLKNIKPLDRLNVQIEMMQVLNKWIQSYSSSVSTTVHSNIVPEISLEIDELSS